IVVPFAAGGVQDILARAISAELGAQLGRNVIVENRPGAGNTIGTAFVAKAAPDGNTLILAAASHTISGSPYSKLSYHPINDFTAVAHIGTVDYVLMTSATIPAKSVAEFVAYAKANPGKLNYASAGNGSATHLAMAYFASLAGIELVHVPYKATGEAINEVLAGRSHAVIPANIGALAFVKDERVRILAATASHRSKFRPEPADRRGERDKRICFGFLARLAGARRHPAARGREHQRGDGEASARAGDPGAAGEAGDRAPGAQRGRLQYAPARGLRQDG